MKKNMWNVYIGNKKLAPYSGTGCLICIIKLYMVSLSPPSFLPLNHIMNKMDHLPKINTQHTEKEKKKSAADSTT